MSKRKQMPARKMKPVFLVICEGQSEAAYIELLKQMYRSPVKVIADVIGTGISKLLVNRKVREVKLTPHDQVKVFLVYDMDVETINRKIEECDCSKILSNPCFEIWYLLHSKKVSRRLETDECLKFLKNSSQIWANYDKGKLTDSQKAFLKSNMATAVTNAKQLNENSNPSSSVYRLVEELASSNL